MTKHPGFASRCKPSLESLEERSLLSGGYPVSPGPSAILASPPVHTGLPQPGFFAVPGSDRAPSFFHEVSALPSNGAWSFQPDGLWPSQPDGAAPYPSDGVSQHQAEGVSAYQTGDGPALQLFIIVQVRFESSSNLQIEPGAAPVPAPLAAALSSSQSATIEPEPATLGPLFAQANGNAASANGVPVVAGRGFSQEPGVTNSLIAPTATLPPTQLVSLLDADSVVTTRLVSQGEASPAVNPLGGSGLDRDSRTATSRSGTAVKNSAGLYPTSYVSADLAGVEPDELLRPSSADLIANVLPFDRAALEKAIDHFFQQFEDLDARDLVAREPARFVMLSLALASTFTALELVRRRWRRWGAGNDVLVRSPLDGGDHIGFPELPGSWSSRLS